MGFYYLVLLFATFFCFSSISVHAYEGNGISVDADEVEYDLEHGYVLAKGEVKVHGEGYQVYADFIKLDLITYTLYSQGDVYFIRKDGSFKGSEVLYHIKDERGEVKGLTGKFYNFILQGDSLNLEPGGKGIFFHGSMTSCDLDNPCYTLKAKRVTFIPDKEIFAENVTLFIKGIPIFYLPTYTKSFEQGAPTLPPIMKLEYDNQLGIVFRYSQSFRVGHNGYGRLGGIYASKRGLDLELNYSYLFTPRLLAGLKVVRQWDSILIGEASLSFKKNWGTGKLDSNITYLWNQGLSGALSHSRNFPNKRTLNFEIGQKVRGPLLGTVSLNQERMGYTTKIEYSRGADRGDLWYLKPEASISLKPMILGNNMKYFGGIRAAFIEENEVQTWRGNLWASMELEPFVLDKVASVKFKGGAGHFFYGTYDTQSYIDGIASLNLNIGSVVNSSLVYERRISTGDSPFRFDKFYDKSLLKGTLTMDIDDRWKISASGEMDLTSRVFTKLKYEVVRDLHCFEAHISFEPFKKRWDARIDLVSF